MNTLIRSRPTEFVVIGAALLAAAAYLLLQRPLAPEVRFSMIDGTHTSMRALRGKVVYLNFWATSCTTCIKEMPDVVKTYRRFAPEAFDLVAVAMSYDPPGYVRNYAAQHQLPFKIVLDEGGAIAEAFDHVNLTPTAILVDKEGRILRRIVGEPDFPALATLIEQEMKR